MTTLDCALCGKPSVSVEAGTSLCMEHLTSWLMSRECKTARRIWGPDITTDQEKRETQVLALMKLWREQQKN